MTKAASARAEAEAKAKASAAAKTMASSVTVGAAATATYNNNPTKDKSVSNTTSSTLKSEACRTSLSMALTGKHSEGLERYLNTLEKQHGTSYVSENVFKNGNKYIPTERAAEISGLNQAISNDVVKNNNIFLSTFLDSYNALYIIQQNV